METVVSTHRPAHFMVLRLVAALEMDLRLSLVVRMSDRADSVEDAEEATVVGVATDTDSW